MSRPGPLAATLAFFAGLAVAAACVDWLAPPGLWRLGLWGLVLGLIVLSLLVMIAAGVWAKR